ncbi:MaoC/PaaZ C-terminal domain-containing protein [Halomicrococcus sp. SG-WS-1]|uniref:MaoC/PaaZ C-terminal domain-containing protein n=1 Tax=Halomicrococcus sp. SG-WS-1 TaxID=3439057 RepID=UPI003F790453
MGDALLAGFYDEIDVGETATTIGRTLTESDVTNYANATGCWLPIHTDREFAAETTYGERVVQGTFLLGLAEGLLYSNEPTGIRANAGMDNIRFHNPVFIGDTVHFEAEVLEKTDRGDSAGIVTLGIEGKNQDDQTVVEYQTNLLMQTSNTES